MELEGRAGQEEKKKRKRRKSSPHPSIFSRSGRKIDWIGCLSLTAQRELLGAPFDGGGNANKFIHQSSIDSWMLFGFLHLHSLSILQLHSISLCSIGCVAHSISLLHSISISWKRKESKSFNWIALLVCLPFAEQPSGPLTAQLNKPKKAIQWIPLMPHQPQRSSFLLSAHSEERKAKKRKSCWWLAAVHSPPLLK